MDPIRVCILRADMRQYTGAINAPETTDCFWKYWADLARERERQWTTARANQIGHRRSCLVLSARFLVVKWRSISRASVAKSS